MDFRCDLWPLECGGMRTFPFPPSLVTSALTNSPAARGSKVTLSGDLPNRVCVTCFDLSAVLHRTHTLIRIVSHFKKNNEPLFKINKRPPPCCPLFCNHYSSHTVRMLTFVVACISKYVSVYVQTKPDFFALPLKKFFVHKNNNWGL